MDARKLAGMFAMLLEMSAMKTDSDAEFLRARGWMPLGKEAFTQVPGWAKMIDGDWVTVGQPQALAIERAKGAK